MWIIEHIIVEEHVILINTISQIKAIDSTAMQRARFRQDDLIKPRGSLGRLEEISIQIAGIQGKVIPVINNKVIITMAGDHGIVASGVSAYPQEVTAQMVINFLNGGAGINVLSQHIDARIVVVDMGVSSDLDPHPDLLVRKVAYGTQDMTLGPAMTHEQAMQALQTGIDIANTEIQNGANIIGTGDMGIGNTTPSTAIASVLSGKSPGEIAGRGTGLNDEGLKRKIHAINKAIVANQPDAQDGLDILAKMGGFEIGGLTGVMLGAAAQRKAIMVDGFISTAAAMIAVKLAPQIKPYLIASHRSAEKGHDIMLEWLGLHPLVELGMRLGEGTGAAIGISLAEAACKLLAGMATFSEGGVTDKEDPVK